MTVDKVVFGEVLDNKGLIREIENLTTQADKPTKDVIIAGMFHFVYGETFVGL